MADDGIAQGSALGPFTTRNVDTVEYLVLKPLRDGLPKVGERFLFWPWGMHFGWIVNLGPVAKIGEIADWVANGSIKDTAAKPPRKKPEAKAAEPPAEGAVVLAAE